MDEWTEAELKERVNKWFSELERIKSQYAHPMYANELQEALDAHYLELPNWWVCQMIGGGWFAVMMDTVPDGCEIITGTFKIAANSYNLIYGPCTQREADDYMADVEN